MLDNENSRLSRLVALLTQLQTKRLLTSTELAARFQVSIRTIYRDIRTLTQAGVPVVTEEGKGYRLLEGYRLPPILFTEPEANALITAEKLVLVNQDTSFTHHYTTALTKIKAVLRDGANDKAALLSERVAFEQNTAENVPSDFLSAIQLALTNLQVINIEYYSPHTKETTNRPVEPFALINRVGESWYLIAWCRLRRDYRLFRFDRIKKLEITNTPFLPHKMGLEEYLAAYRNKFKPLT